MVQDARTRNADRTSLRHWLGRRDRRTAYRDRGDEASIEPSASMKTRDHITHEITWIDSGREPQCKPSPAYPDGIDVPSPRPAAKRIGSLASSSWSSAKQLRPRHSPFDPRSTLLVCSSPTEPDPILTRCHQRCSRMSIGVRFQNWVRRRELSHTLITSRICWRRRPSVSTSAWTR